MEFEHNTAFRQLLARGLTILVRSSRTPVHRYSCLQSQPNYSHYSPCKHLGNKLSVFLRVGLELQIRPTLLNLTPHSWIWCRRSTQYWSGNCLSSSTKSTGMEGARRNGNASTGWWWWFITIMWLVQWTRHILKSAL